ncbi:transporter [Sulfuriroseicoccus oceanibius]|uniref:Uncharacterized protein n=1 Tax=Sulfuriroseicoccus oceanibius TaxID=2707525 RepID=A0A6B3L569_9BACT|nr:transporter [Sulfuriroseicoccus oceanibius]QQL45375.1 hypothetical protein G3M56_001935 [Sulfuriroseicoccus oceanibius]
MKLTITAAAALTLVPAIAGTPSAKSTTCACASVAQPDPLAHAPAGIMPDHAHAKGEWMVGYHLMRMEMGGHRQGTNDLTTAQVFELGFQAAAESMTMDMHMLELMYAPTDWLTLMVMANYIQNDMTMSMRGSHGGHGMMGAMPAMQPSQHSHTTEGWGDTSLTAIIPLLPASERTSLTAGLGISAPTGDVGIMSNGMFTHYDMQLGSGTWDLLPSLTWKHNLNRFQLGAQIDATLRLEDANDSGYRKGHRIGSVTWVGARVTDWLAVHTTLSASTEGEIEGHYNGPHRHSAPNDFQANYGGDLIEAGGGATILTPCQWGLLGNHTLGIRATTPVYQDLNGIGMTTDWTLNVSWQKSF